MSGALGANAQLGHYADTVINGKVCHHVDEPPFEGYYYYVDQMPEAGYDFKAYLKRVMHYPDSAIHKNVQGRVLVGIVINEDGSITDCKVVKGIGGGCDEEALRVIKNMPRWKPAKQNGKPMKMEFLLPIKFTLE